MTPEQKSALESAIAHFERNGFWEAAELRGILDEEARRTVSGQEAIAFPEIKGAWIDGGYVIVTPAGIGNAPALKEAILKAAAPIPATDADTADYKRMFEEAVSALAAIDKALGIDPDEAGGAAPILEAIERLRDDGNCRSCVGDKCVTGPECVTLGRDAAGASNERADAEKDAGLVYACQKALSAVSHSRTIYEAEAYLQRLLDAAILAAKEKKS